MVARRTTYGQMGGVGGNAVSPGAAGRVQFKRSPEGERVTQANAGYGALVLEQIGSIFENSEERAVYG